MDCRYIFSYFTIAHSITQTKSGNGDKFKTYTYFQSFHEHCANQKSIKPIPLNPSPSYQSASARKRPSPARTGYVITPLNLIIILRVRLQIPRRKASEPKENTLTKERRSPKHPLGGHICLHTEALYNKPRRREPWTLGIATALCTNGSSSCGLPLPQRRFIIRSTSHVIRRRTTMIK